MAYCVKCGARVEDDLRFCPYCGAEIPVVGKTSDRTENTYTAGSSEESQGYTYYKEGTTGSQTCNGQQAYSGQQSFNGQQAYSGQQSFNEQQAYDGQQSFNGQQNYYGQQAYGGQTGYFEASEVKRNKAMGVLSYLGILVLIPLLAGDKSSPYVKHHANQGLVFFILSSIVDFLDGKWIGGFYSWFSFGGNWFSWIVDLADFACLILLVMGIVSACKGTRQELPIIGKIRILK